jgi:hypothetical protein
MREDPPTSSQMTTATFSYSQTSESPQSRLESLRAGTLNVDVIVWILQFE